LNTLLSQPGPSARAELCTLVVPTHNRPLQFEQQFRYLAAETTQYPIVVADSSDPSTARKNRDLVNDVSRARYVHFAPSKIFEKFSSSLQEVDTAYCMFVPDDDFVWLGALPRLVQALDDDAGCSAVHGHYFEFFTRGPSVHVTQVIQSGADIRSHSPSDRVVDLMASYEALTYACYRTEVAKASFAAAATQSSILAQELLQAAITVARGTVKRLPFFSHGRRAESSLGYANWHPTEWLAVDPASLFSAYQDYRSELVGELCRLEAGTARQAIERKVDLAHLAYLSGYLNANVLREIARYNPHDVGREGVVETVREFWAREYGSRWTRFLRNGNRIVRFARRRFRALGMRDRLASLVNGGARANHIEKIDEAGTSGDIRFRARLPQQLTGTGPDRRALAVAIAKRELS